MSAAHRYDLRLQTLSPALLFTIGQIDEHKGRWAAGGQLNPQLLARLKRSVLVTSTGASTRIEGARLSDEEIEKMMRGLSIQKFAERDQQEVNGYFELLRNVFDSWATLSFTESTIRHFHQELLKYVEQDVLHRGDYKRNENRVLMVDAAGESIGVLFETTPAWQTPSAMSELVTWTQGALAAQQYHPLLVIGHFLVEFLAIHPFQDGNGRLSRILTNFLLLKSGYLYTPYVSHEKLIEDNKPDYYLALRTSQKTFQTESEDIQPWLAFFCQVLLVQARQAVALLTNEYLEKTLSRHQWTIWQYLQQVQEATPQEIATATGIARPTVTQALNRLLQLQRIERLGQGRGVRYRVQES
ncbi:Fic family protein [Prosthecobacter sp.]|uniref:Fic family protein n=1 Tax=Prosthecobacter sp. TaxID=1965333 RepID=UPI0037832184